MEYIFDPQKIQIGATGLPGLYQQIYTLLATRKGSVPLDRDFGISWDFIDSPINKVKPAIIAEIIMQMQKYIPKIKVTDIEFKKKMLAEGVLYPKITFIIREEYKNEFQ